MFKKQDKIEVTFIVIYFIEQIALVLLYLIKSDLMAMWISIFPVIFLSTMAIEKVFLKVDFKEQLDDLTRQGSDEIKRDVELKKFKTLFREALKK